MAILTVLMLALLSVESIRLPVRAYISPPTAFLAFVVTAWAYYRRPTFRTTPLFTITTIFAVYVLVHSVILLAVDLMTVAPGWHRVFLWFRQAVAFSIGLSVFYAFRRGLRTLSHSTIYQAILVGSIPAFLIGLLTLSWIVAGIELFARIAQTIQWAIAPLGAAGAARTSGLSSEPAHFAFFLVSIIFPTILLGYHNAAHQDSGSRWLWIVGGVLALSVFAGTLSTSGVLILGVFVMAALLANGRFMIALGAIVAFVVSVFAFVTLFPGTYLAAQLTTLLSLNWGTSILTRFYSTVGPLINAFSTVHGFIGYGLGGSNAHLHTLSEGAVQQLQRVSWTDSLNLKTLVGRIIFETGIIGMVLFFALPLMAYRQLATQYGGYRPWDWPFRLQVASAAVIATVFAHGIAMGSFAIPYLWFWYGFIDSEYARGSKGAFRGDPQS